MSYVKWVRERLPFEFKFGIVSLYIYTTEGLESIERLSESNLWDRWNDIGIGAMVVSMVGFLLFLVFSSVYIILSDPPASSGTKPSSLVAIPGVNDYIPIEHAGVFLLALFVAVLVHEAGHAIAMRRENVDIQEWGIILFLGVIPLGAYVNPDEDELENQPFREYARILSAGIANNYVISIVTALYFILLPQTPSLTGVFAQHFSILLGGTGFFELSLVTTLVYWQLFIHVNLGLVNTLPIVALDGGRVFGKFVECYLGNDRSYNIPSVGEITKSGMLTAGATITSILLFSLLAFGPYF